MPEEEIEILIGRAKRRLDAAYHLFEDGFYEDAVSRAYYSMYFAAKALLLKKDITVKTHKGLLSKFGLEFVNEGVVEEYYGRAGACYRIQFCGGLCHVCDGRST